MQDEPKDIRRELRLLLADRSAPEARAMFEVLLRYIHNRVRHTTRSRQGRITPNVREELASDVLVQLMRGSLAAFRGETLPELLGFVRTVTDRTVWRAIRSSDREQMVDFEFDDERVAGPIGGPHHAEFVGDSPLPSRDQEYLMELLQAGSKAELARRAGVSRAAVTQRVQRIRTRVDSLAANDKMAHEVWLHQAARSVLEEEALEVRLPR